MKVRVYFNLHRKCWSVQDYATRRVIDHTDYIVLKDVTFKVYQAGRNRVLAEQTKNVHAFVVGDIVNPSSYVIAEQVRYNPYQNESFVYTPNQYSKGPGLLEPIYSTQYALLQSKKVFRLVDVRD